MPRPRLHMDFEGFSVLDITDVGAAMYAERCVPFITGLKVDDEPTKVYDHSENFNGGIDDFGDFDQSYAIPPPPEYVDAINEDADIVAHNAPFEFNVLLRSPALVEWPKPRVERMICTAAKSRFYGYPGKLEKVGEALKLDIQKDKRGTALINKFCKPQKTGRAKGASTYIRTINPHDPDWIAFRDEYNWRDVETEYRVDKAFPDIPEKFAKVFYMDFRMNLRGFPVDIEAVRIATEYFQYFDAQLKARCRELTGGLSPTQVEKFRQFIDDTYSLYLPNLQAATIRDLLLEDDLHPEARELLVVRQEASKSSVSKLEAFMSRTALDGRSRDGFMWYGAHTGRWSGRGVQPQNFPRGVKGALKLLPCFYAWLEALAGASPTPADLATAELVFPDPMTVLSSALRGFIKAPKGKLLLSVDYAQIELRILAWLAGETELLEQLRSGLDPYIQFAGNYMYGVDPATIDKDDVRRQIAKSALLGAQYQIWIDAFIEYCKATAGLKITREEATNAIISYRTANPNIVQFWRDIEKAAIFAVESQGTAQLNNLRLKFEVINGREWLRIYLPSGRPLSYPWPEVRVRVTEEVRKDMDGNPVIGPDGDVVTYTKKKKVLSFMTEYSGRWMKEYTYGGKITENVVQAIAADVMGTGMLNCEDAMFDPIATVHDEAVLEVPELPPEDMDALVKEVEALVCDLPPCYEGLPIAAEGFWTRRYSKGARLL